MRWGQTVRGCRKRFTSILSHFATSHYSLWSWAQVPPLAHGSWGAEAHTVTNGASKGVLALQTPQE